jgi:hypothetical protein
VLLNTLSTPAPEPDVAVLDPATASPSHDLVRKRRREYDLNRHFQDHWAAKMPWAEAIIGASGQVTQVHCKICSEVEQREKLLVPKIDSFYKHTGRRRVLADIGKVRHGEYYYLSTNPTLRTKEYSMLREETRSCKSWQSALSKSGGGRWCSSRPFS